MATVVKSIDRTITSQEIIPLLNKYGLLSRLAYEDIIDQAIATVKCTAEELAEASKIWQHQLNHQTQYLNQEEILLLTARNFKIEKFKQLKWRDRLPAYFHSRKKQLDRVVYSVVRTQSKNVAREMHFRLIEAEQTLIEMARGFAPEHEVVIEEGANLVELGSLPPAFVQQLTEMKTNSVSSPFIVGDWFVVVRLEKYVAAQCDRQTRIRLLNELFNDWMKQQLRQHKYHLEEN